MARHLVLILGDQLDHHAAGLDGFDPKQDCIWMAEVKEESSHVPSSKQRIALFLSAMRQFAKELKSREWPLDYIPLDSRKNTQTLIGELKRAIDRHKPSRLIMTAPGDWRVLQKLRSTAEFRSRFVKIAIFFQQFETSLNTQKAESNSDSNIGIANYVKRQTS
jgi:deoxyribodipyrimidine photolyase-related protein